MGVSHVDFRTTRWSLVRQLGASAPAARAALETLCELYWPAVRSFMRRQGASPAEADDLAQTLFAEMIARGDLDKADPVRGRFRAYVLTCCRHLLWRVRDRERALKRGGDRQREPLDPEQAAAADPHFDREWAELMVARAKAQLRDEAQAQGKLERHERLLPLLTEQADGATYAELAEALGSTPAAAKVAVHRLRKRFASALRAEVTNTVDDPQLIDDELAALRDALARSTERER